MKITLSLSLIFITYFLIAQESLTEINLKGIEFTEAGKYDEAFHTLNSGLQRSRREGNAAAEARVLNSLGYLFLRQKDHEEATAYYQESRQIATKVGDSIILASDLFNLGIIYSEKGLHERAMENLLFAVRIYERTADTVSLSSCLSEIGSIHGELGDFRLAMGYYLSALRLVTESRMEEMRASLLNNIGNLCKDNGQYDSAIWYLFQALHAKERIGDTLFTSTTLMTLGETYHAMKQFQRAEQFYKKAYIMRKMKGYKRGIASSANKLGSLFLDLRDFNAAEKFLQEATPLALTGHLNELLLENYNSLRQLHRHTGKTMEALRFDDLYIQLNDSLNNEQKNKALAEMQIKYETEKKDRELLTLGQERDLQEIRYSLVILCVITLFVIVVIVLSAYYRKKRDERRINLLLKELNHRVKNNLQILSDLSEIQYEQLSNEEAQQAIRDNHNRIKSIALIHQRLYHDKDITSIRLHVFIKEISEDLAISYGFSDKTLKLSHKLSEIEVDVNKAIPICLIINELVTNALKYAFVEHFSPEITIELAQNENELKLSVTDNGKGICEHQRTNSMGYHLINLLLKQVNATIEISSIQGTQVNVNIPWHKKGARLL